MINRVFLFLATNFAVITVISVVGRLFGLDSILAQNGQNMSGLLFMCAAFGMIGSFISLAMSKSSAKRSTGAQVIENPANVDEQWLFDTVQNQAQMAGIDMPEIAVYDSPDINAFATGMKKNDALVAVSSGLLNTMTRKEAEAVLAHEISHVANGDMVTLSLIQGVVNTFVMFFARIVAQVMSGNRQGGGGGGMGYFVTYMIAQSIFGFLASIIVMYFSRVREFKADEGGATLAGKANMIAALERLNSQQAPTDLPEQIAAFGISSGRGKFGRLFMSHPPLPERIAVLEQFNG